MKHDFEIYGTKGSIKFSQERLNELYFFHQMIKKIFKVLEKLKLVQLISPMIDFVWRQVTSWDLMNLKLLK